LGAFNKVADCIKRYNTQRLHSAIGYITPLDKLEGRADAIQAERQRKLIAARQARKQQRKVSYENGLDRHQRATDNTNGRPNGRRC